MLDAIGDLFYVRPQYHWCLYRIQTGHALNNKLLQAVLAKESARELVTFENEAQMPVAFRALSTVLA